MKNPENPTVAGLEVGDIIIHEGVRYPVTGLKTLAGMMTKIIHEGPVSPVSGYTHFKWFNDRTVKLAASPAVNEAVVLSHEPDGFACNMEWTVRDDAGTLLYRGPEWAARMRQRTWADAEGRVS